MTDNQFTLKTPYGSYQCKPVLHRYADNGRLALRLVDAADNSPIATASVNFPEASIPEGYIAIKNWSENEGILESLMEAGIVAPPSYAYDNGSICSPICKLLITQ